MPSYLSAEDYIKNTSFRSLTDLCDISDGNHLKIADCFQDVGHIPYFRGQDINTDFFLENSTPVYIPENVYTEGYMQRSHFKVNDILMSIVGTVGSIALVTDKFEKCTGSCKLAILRVKNIDAYYLSAFLQSKYGQLQIKRNTRGAVQTGLLLEDMDQIFVYNPVNEYFLDLVSKLIKFSIFQNRNSKSIYAKAEGLLLKELGLLGWKPEHKLFFVKNFDEVSSANRMDAEYFQPKYDEILAAIKSYSNGFYKLSDIGNFENGSLISEDFYTEKAQRAYIRIKELSLDAPIKKDIMTYINDDFKSTNETKVLENDFVIATIGNTIGKVNRIDAELSGSFISNNTTRYRLDNKLSHFCLEQILRNRIVQMQVEKEFTQTAQPKITNKSLGEIIIPKLNHSLENNIDELVKDSYKCWEQTKQLLEIAKQGVEIAIEQDEDAATTWINQELEKISVVL